MIINIIGIMEFQNQYQLSEIKKKINYEMWKTLFISLLSFHLTDKNSRAVRSTEAEGKWLRKEKWRKTKKS